MANIHDVARQAKVSPATVSRVLNGRFGVGTETRDRVLAAAESLNYRPSSAARNLRRSRQPAARERTHAIGFLTARDTVLAGDPFAREVAAAVERALCSRGLDVHVLALTPDGHLPPDIRHGKVDGIIGRLAGPLFREAARHLPAVNLDVYEPEADAYSLMPDYAQGAYDITRRLLETGHSRLALMTHAPKDQTPMFWSAFARGCLRAFSEAGLDPWPGLFQGTAGLPSQGYQLGLRLFRGPAQRPDAMVGPDGALLGVYRAAGECGVRIPEHVSLVGINNLPLDEYLWPPLTSLDVGLPDLAARAVSLLEESLESGVRRKGLELTPVSLCVRQSARL